jgi:hypothetical protein
MSISLRTLTVQVPKDRRNQDAALSGERFTSIIDCVCGIDIA